MRPSQVLSVMGGRAEDWNENPFPFLLHGIEDRRIVLVDRHVRRR